MRTFKWKRSRVKRIEICYLVPTSGPATRWSDGEVELVAAVNRPADDSRQQNTEGEGVKRYVLLKEVEETNNWGRSGFQLFVGWFALQFIVNIVAMGFLIYKNPMPTFARSVYAVLIGWNFVGMIGSLLLHKSIHDCDLRIREVIDTVVKNTGTYDPPFKAVSGIPLRAINIVFISCAVTLFALMAFWTIVFVK